MEEHIRKLEKELSYERGKNKTYEMLFDKLGIQYLNSSETTIPSPTIIPNNNIKTSVGEENEIENIMKEETIPASIFDIEKNISPKTKEKVKNKKMFPNATHLILVEENVLKERRIANIKNFYIEKKKYDCHKIKKNKERKDKNVSKIKEKIQLIRKNILTPKKEKEILDYIKKLRIYISKFLSLSEYIQMINNYINDIESISVQKKYNFSKKNQMIMDGCSSLELRLVKHRNYIDTNIDWDEISNLEHILKYESSIQKMYKIFSYSRIQTRMQNYGTILTQIMKPMKRYLINSYGFQTIIYLDGNLFYRLKEVTSKSKRYWILDFRLQQLTNKLTEFIVEYLTTEYRNIYKDVFQDNVYREDKTNKQVFEIECEQIIQNLVFVLAGNNFNHALMKLIKNGATYTPSQNDFFDSFETRNCKEDEPNPDEENFLVIKSLFDSNISDETTRNIYYSTFDKIKHLVK